MSRAWIAAFFLTALCLISTARSESVTLTWTAPGDDIYTGRAAKYDLRYSTGMINEDNWEYATQVTGMPTPQPAGSLESVTIDGFDEGRAYFFALKTADENNNWSSLSNIHSNAKCYLPCSGIRGNVDADPYDKVNISDFQYLIHYLFGIPRGPKPVCPLEANVNGDPDEAVTVADVTYLANYLFGIPNGPMPPRCP